MTGSKRALAYLPWILLVVVCLGLAAITWVFGPLLIVGKQAVLQDPALRLFVVLVILLLGIIAGLGLLLRPRRASLPEAPDSPATSDEYGKQTQSLDRAMHRLVLMLRQLHGAVWHNRFNAYQVPWYLVLGPAGAGKSALILNSGLRFGGADRRASHIAAGPAYTLSLADKAVFVDTGGLLGSQTDRRIWRYFLTLLKRFRRQQPANGVILTLSLPEFRAAPHTQVFALASDIRQQLGDMLNQLGVRLPVYVVFTKIDELPGFRAFFGGKTAFPRDGVLGVTLPLLDSSGFSADHEDATNLFSRSFDELVHWHMPRTLERVNSEAETGNRFDAFMFLPELAGLKSKLADFVEEAFKPSQFEEPQLLRGVYFTSARPDESAAPQPMRLAGVADDAPIQATLPAQGMFIRDLIEKVILPEAGLAGLNAGARKKATTTRLVIAMTVAVIAALMMLWWAISFQANSRLIDSVRSQAESARSALTLLGAPASTSGDNSASIALTLAALKSLADLPTGWNATEAGPTLGQEAGLSQHDALAAATQAEYVRALRTIFLPHFTRSLETQINNSMAEPNELYSALMVYLMLGGEHAIENDVVLGWTGQHCGQIYPGPDNAGLCINLRTQLQNLLQVGFTPIPVNQPLVARARSVLDTFSPALRGMALLRASSDITSLPPWQLTDVTGPLASYAMVRRSGRSLSESIPGLYTSAAFSSVVLPKIANVAKRVIREDWVRYPNADKSRMPVLINNLRQEMIGIYTGEYVSQWEGLLNDVDLAPFSTFPAEFSMLQSLSGPPSPYKAFLLAVAQNTTLTQAKSPTPDQLPNNVKQQVTQTTDDAAPARAITNHFATLHRFVAGNPSSLDELMKLVNQLRAIIGPVASSGGSSPALITEMTSGQGFAQTLSELQHSVVSAPPPVADSVITLVRQTSAIANTGVRTDLDGAWKAQVLPFCQLAINRRYPFANSANDVTVADFTRMFAPAGLLDQFFNRQLKPFVDTSVSPWKLLANAGARPDISPKALGLFEQASKIRTVFFPGGAPAAQVAFAITPTDLDPGAMRVTLEVDGSSLTYQYGPMQTVTMQWPGAVPGIRVGFGAVQQGQPSFITVNGPWALFRFLAAHQFKRTSATQFAFTVNLGPRTASFSLQAATVENPFRQNVMNGFRCPPSLVAG